jgi:hypothetical protein
MKFIVYEKSNVGVQVVATSDKIDKLKYMDSLNEEFEYTFEKKYSTDQYKDYTVLTINEFWLDDDLIDRLTSAHGRPDVVLNTFYTRIDLKTEIPVYLIDAFFARFVNYAPKFSIVNDSTAINTFSSFNFMVNRKRINRHLMIKILEHFDLIKNAEYTWSKSDVNYDLSPIIQELDSISAAWAQDIKSAILSPIKLDQKWISVASDKTMSNTNITTSNIEAWNQGLCSIFNNTSVSLISESIDYQSGIGFTEKSIYPVLGLNLPIWIGGKYQASEFEKFGFDVFDDIIDHSYQYCDTLIERCYRAIADNLDILSNFDLAAKTRQDVMPRLLKNRQLLLTIAADRHMQHQRALNCIKTENVPEIVTDIVTEIVSHSINRNSTK